MYQTCHMKVQLLIGHILCTTKAMLGSRSSLLSHHVYDYPLDPNFTHPILQSSLLADHLQLLHKRCLYGGQMLWFRCHTRHQIDHVAEDSGMDLDLGIRHLIQQSIAEPNGSGRRVTCMTLTLPFLRNKQVTSRSRLPGFIARDRLTRSSLVDQ